MVPWASQALHQTAHAITTKADELFMRNSIFGCEAPQKKFVRKKFVTVLTVTVKRNHY